MYISSLRIERLALKEYFANGDHLAEEDEDDSRSENSDIMYHGGHSAPKKSGQRKKAEAAGCCQRIFGSSLSQGNNQRPDLSKMTEEQKRKHVADLWAKAKRFTSRIRFQARLQRMAESNLKEMMVEDIADDGFDDHNQSDSVGTN